MKNRDREKRLEELLRGLVKIPSITGSPEECLPVEYLTEECTREPYFQEHPEYYGNTPKNDSGKCSFFALVKAARPTRKTVLFISHFDVVDVDVYGDLAHAAWEPDVLEDLLDTPELPEHLREALESGNWIFGRGVMDMKCGVALELELLLEFARNPAMYNVNVAMLGVYDEEGSNEGMVRGVPFLAQKARELDLDFIGAVNTEPSDAGMSGTPDPLLFDGSMGKCLVMFYAVGKDAHCGSYFKGMSASLIQSCVNQEFEGNPIYSESVEGTVSLPPALLSERVVQEGPYSVTIPYRCVSYYNVFTLQNNPGAVMGLMLEGASRAAREAMLRLNGAWEELRRRGYRGEGDSSAWEVEVLTFEELRRRAAIHYPGDFAGDYQGWIDGTDPSLDLREKSIRLVERLLPWRGNRNPLLVVGFLSPFMPHRLNRGESPRGRRFLELGKEIRREALERYGRKIGREPFFGGLCDLSYLGWEQDSQDFRILQSNLPGWGDFYSLPVEAMRALDMPVLNFGPLGRDPHQYTERLERDYALRELPELLRLFLKGLGEDS